jgi:putative peptidoglycan lipid II flippase
MNLLRAAASVSGMTLASRITGFIRDTLLAVLFGAGLTMDAFVVAFRIPNLLRRLFAEGAFSQAFVPVIGDYRNRKGEEATRELAAKVLGALSVALFIATAIGIVAAPVVVYLSAYGFAHDAEKFALTVAMLRICFPYILFISLVAFAAGLLNTYGSFKAPAFTPVLLNLSIIAFALAVAPHLERPVMALAWGVFFGGLAQLAFQIPFLRHIGMLVRPRWPRPEDEGVRRILRLMAPAALGVSVAQVSLLINTQIASWLGDGPVSWLYYADRLMEFPSALLGVALGTVLLPALVRHHSAADAAAYSRLLDWGLRLALVLAAPAAIALGLLAVPLIATLFWHGEFTRADVIMTRHALIGYAVGLTGIILVKILAPGFYARQNVRTPVRVAIATLVITQILNAALVPWLGHAGLALSISLAACFNAAWLWVLMRRAGAYHPEPGWGAFLLKLAVALYIMGGALWYAMGSESSWFAIAAGARALRLTLVIAAGTAAYFGALWAMGLRLRDFSRHE